MFLARALAYIGHLSLLQTALGNITYIKYMYIHIYPLTLNLLALAVSLVSEKL